ncbi:MAG TPA: hypothetical protein VK932_00115 [Kofleriaceae bacterium]|nr:hypothetical protein [Kofleriaceae bacterium]
MRTTFLHLLVVFVFGILGVASCLSSEPLGQAEADVSEPAVSERLERPDLIECRYDTECPRGSYCEPGLAACFTGSRCYVDGRPSDELCERLYGDDFICHEYAPDSHHCMPTE